MFYPYPNTVDIFSRFRLTPREACQCPAEILWVCLRLPPRTSPLTHLPSPAGFFAGAREVFAGGREVFAGGREVFAGMLLAPKKPGTHAKTQAQ